MPITQALITSAGFGTRFLPISKTIQKEMLPLLNRPMIDYVVDDCVRAGIEQIIFVINEHNYQTLHYYRENQRLRRYLQRMNKAELYEQVKHLHHKAEFHFVKQTDQDPYGTAVPVLLAKDFLQPGQPFLYMTGDDFVFHPDSERSLAADLIKLYQQYQPQAVLTCDTRPEQELSRYGVAAVEQKVKQGQKLQFLTQLVEKPSLDQAPSNLVNISKYILPGNVIDVIKQQQPNPKSGELYITDTVQSLASQQEVLVHQIDGCYLDGGNVANWLKANLVLAQQDPELKQVVKQLVATW
jgi:UTP--glucose-1-phosphate uridylyltransferase